MAAHPDDEVLGLGGTIRRHVDAGDAVTAVIASDGATSRYESEAIDTLQTHCRAAADVLGISEVHFLSLPDQRLDTLPKLDIVQAIEEHITSVRPAIVYAHHWGDVNTDHRAVSEAVVTSCRPVGDFFPRKLHLFETPSSTEWGAPDPTSQFTPTRFVDITDTIDRKLEAMACYETELRPAPHPRSLDALRSRAAYWGQTVGCAYAEPFVVVREVD